jgi:acetoin utilization protein AcuB
MINVWDVVGVPTLYDRERVEKVRRAEKVHAYDEDEFDRRSREAVTPDALRAGRGYNPWREARERTQTEGRRDQALQAKQIMSTTVRALAPSTSVAEAWSLCRALRFRHFPVVEEQDGKLVGILSDRDLLRVGGTPDAAPVPDVGDLQVADIMSSPVFSAHPETPIRDIARVLFAERIGAIAICDDDWKLVGILTRSDILRTLVNKAPLDLWV